MNQLKRIKPEDLAELAYLEGNGNYTYHHTQSGKKTLWSYTLKRFTEMLPDFMQAHKRYLINPEAINCIRVIDPKGPVVLLKNGTRLPVSRRRLRVFVQQFHAYKASQV